ncbi:hypothetical protein SAMN05443572_105590 [Myxococcus fulvus]|uniref:Uncharacterized protein n=1 Tax=Myxococcus fulvus TaxID=33 RepID=A0A511T595_MYXFU|nr:hypothetical protein [Myxococcus fulvus]GEN09335.1 hypothetical protein MFU01_43720 [Myxococcus fulvus]SEU17418.1 hypothetical protein SAMN05443572_105590 [Myxococcus fulvus]
MHPGHAFVRIDMGAGLESGQDPMASGSSKRTGIHITQVRETPEAREARLRAWAYAVHIEFIPPFAQCL